MAKRFIDVFAELVLRRELHSFDIDNPEERRIWCDTMGWLGMGYSCTKCGHKVWVHTHEIKNLPFSERYCHAQKNKTDSSNS